MKFNLDRTWFALIACGAVSLGSIPAQAALVDGQISAASEYRWNTTAPPNSKWYTRGGNEEVDDGSGGNNWDINYLGTDIAGGQFQIGAGGGSILGGQNDYRDAQMELSDIAINVVAPGEVINDPAADSTGWDYALRLSSVDSAGNALFSLYALLDPAGAGAPGQWIGSGKGAASPTYQHESYSYGSTRTFLLQDGYELASGIAGMYTAPDPDGDNGVLEVSFDLGLLSLFDEQTGGRIITYLTMSCVNDEAIVEANVSPVPIPSAVWLFGSALIGFIGMSRRTRV